MGKDQFTPYDPLEELLPKGGWLGKYMDYTKGLEACARFRFFTACCVLGACINNKIWIIRGEEGLLPKLFPNVWVILLAPPGRGHKTSTINMGVNCLYEACPEVRILADKLTPESLVQSLSMPVTEKDKFRIGPSDATGLIKAPELSVFFGKQQYNTGLVSLITDLYDFREEWKSETIMRGKNVLKNNCISILGGSTPDWLQHMLPEDAFTGGFMSRFVLVEMPANYLRRKAFPKKLGKTGWSHVVDGLADLSELKGEMGWTHDCARFYEEYYENMYPSGEIQKDAYQEREAEQILRIGMCLALSEKRMHLEKADFQLAKQIVDALMQETNPRIEKLTTHPRMSLVQDVQALLKQFGPMSEKVLLKKTYRGLALGENQFHEALRVLRAAGVVRVEVVKGEVTYILSGKEMIEDGGDKKDN